MVAAFGAILADTAEEGRNIITAMLLVALGFLMVILLGNGLRWLRHRGE